MRIAKALQLFFKKKITTFKKYKYLSGTKTFNTTKTCKNTNDSINVCMYENMGNVCGGNRGNRAIKETEIKGI